MNDHYMKKKLRSIIEKQSLTILYRKVNFAMKAKLNVRVPIGILKCRLLGANLYRRTCFSAYVNKRPVNPAGLKEQNAAGLVMVVPLN